jgi:hypothetical protein
MLVTRLPSKNFAASHQLAIDFWIAFLCGVVA